VPRGRLTWRVPVGGRVGHDGGQAGRAGGDSRRASVGSRSRGRSVGRGGTIERGDKAMSSSGAVVRRRVTLERRQADEAWWGWRGVASGGYHRNEHPGQRDLLSGLA